MGFGSSATVYRATSRSNGQEVALKLVRSIEGDDEAVMALRREHELNLRLVGCHSPYLVPLVDATLRADKEGHWLAFTLMKGGSVADTAALQRQQPLSEIDAKRVMYNVFGALAVLHRRGVVHCDIKPSNCVLGSPDDFSSMRLIDLGTAQDRKTIDSGSTGGTPAYLSPELCHSLMAGKSCRRRLISKSASLGPAMDVWAAGVMLWELLTGSVPFQGSTPEVLLSEICSAPLPFEGTPWSHVSKEGKALVRLCLDRNARTRLKAKQALSHPWFRGGPYFKSAQTQTSCHWFLSTSRLDPLLKAPAGEFSPRGSFIKAGRLGMTRFHSGY